MIIFRWSPVRYDMHVSLAIICTISLEIIHLVIDHVKMVVHMLSDLMAGHFNFIQGPIQPHHSCDSGAVVLRPKKRDAALPDSRKERGYIRVLAAAVGAFGLIRLDDGEFTHCSGIGLHWIGGRPSPDII